MAEMTPRTAAGKRLLDRLALPWTPDMGAGYEAMIEGIRPVILAIEAEASAEPGALSDGGSWHSDGDQCTGLHCGNPDHGWDERAEPGALREALDVERLAKALRGKDPSAMFVILAGRKAASNLLGEGFAHDLAVIIAAEYAALAREEATSE